LRVGGIGHSLTALAICLMFLLVFFVHLAQVPTAHSWGWTTHYFIETKAELVFSNDPFLSNFLSTYHSTLYSWCTYPDSNKSFMPDGGGEADWHYLDAYSYNPLSYSGGKLPWAMEWIFDNIVQYLKDGDWNTAAQLMGAICHFAADATCPLHATWDYGASPGYHHSEYETAVNNHIGEISIPISDYVPQELDDITNAALATLAESFDFTDEDPNGGVNICDFLEVGISWNDTIKSITEDRLRAAIQFTANVWYTAMVRAGLVGSVSWVNSITPYWRTSIPFTITATAYSSNGYVKNVALWYRHSTDNSSWDNWTLYGIDYSTPWEWSFNAPLGDGYYEFYSLVTDDLNNQESPPAVADARCGVDTVAPASSVNAISPYWWTTSFQITATASDSTSGVKNVSLYYRHSTDNSSWDNWTFWGTHTTPPWSWSFGAPLGGGHYQFYSIAGDKVGNVESAPSSADAMCGVDTVAPASSVNAISPYWWTTSFQITATASDAASGVENVSLYYRYSTDNSGWSALALYGTDTAGPWIWSFIAPSGSGYYEFYSIARDKATKIESTPTEADARCGVDNAAPPAPAKTSPADGTITDNSPTFTWVATTDDLSGIARYELWVDDDPNFSSPEVLENTADNITLNFISPALADGNYSWRVRAWDQAGNRSNFETPWMFSVTTIPWNVEVTVSPSGNSGKPGENVTFTVTVTNTGNMADNYNLTVGDNSGWGLTLSENSLLDVENGASRTVTLTATIPTTGAENYTQDNITVTATSTENSAVSDSASCIAHVIAEVIRGVDVSISPSENSSGNGETVIFVVTITNTGNVTKDYNLGKTDDAGWSLTLQSSVTVPFGENREVTLTVGIPSTAENNTSDSITVTATSSENTAIENSATCVARCVVGAAGRGVLATISENSKSGAPSETLNFTVTVANTGNVADNYSLEATDDAGWGAWLDENQLTILAGENTIAILRVTVPSSASEGDSTTITVTARSQENAQIENSASCTATANRAQPPHDLVPVAVGGTVAGIGAAIAVLLKKGIIYLPSMSSRLRSDQMPPVSKA